MYNDLPVDAIERALAHIPADCGRDEWVQIGMAIKSELGDDGFDIWDRWSAGGNSYNSRDARDTWRSIRADGGVTIATLIHTAKQLGWRPDPQQSTLDHAAIEARRAKREADLKREADERAAQQARAAEQAAAMWEAAPQATSHAYLAKKGISQPGKVRVGTYRRWHRPEGEQGREISIDGALLIPVRDGAGAITSMQAIFPDATNPLGRDRDYLPGGRKQGCYFNIGIPTRQPGEPVYIVEGYATGCTVAEATGALTVIAFDAGNLLAAAQVIRGKLPDAQIVLAADNDAWSRKRDGTPYNPGMEAASAAAAAVGGLVAAPYFADTSSQPTDWNDLQALEGLESVRQQLQGAIEPQPVPAANDNRPRPTASIEFGQPLDVFGVAPPPDLALDILPSPLRAYVLDQAQLTGCDPAIIGMAALVSCAACIDDAIRLQPKRKDPTWTEESRLWVAFVGDPSTKKSPAIAKAVRHVKRIDHRWGEDNAREHADWKQQHESWKDAKKADKSLPEPQQPGAKRLIVEDVTVEALSDILQHNPRGVLTLKDELTGWFASMDAYKSSSKGASMDRAHWLEAYNGGTRKIDRVGRGQIRVPNWSTCIIGGIQPDMIRRVASSMGNDGLLQRFMVVVAKSATMDEDRLPNMDAMQHFGKLFEQLIAIKPSDEPITLSEEAHECRLRVAGFARRMIAAFDHPHLQAWLGKWDGLFGRLLNTYHVIECAASRVHPASYQVGGETAAQVEQLMLGYLLHHAIHFYSEVLDANDRQEHVRQLARLILAKRFDRVTKRDLTQLWKASRKMEWWELRAIIDNLCTMDWLAPDMGTLDTDGKPRAWLVNPAVHQQFEDLAGRELERRREVVETIRAARELYGRA